MVIDTSAVIALFRGLAAAGKCFNAAREVWMPVTVLGELHCGLRKCDRPVKESLRIAELRDRCSLIPIDEETAMQYARIHGDLEKAGTPIPVNDLWIAALAMRHDLPLLAKDGHFSRIDGLDFVAL